MEGGREGPVESITREYVVRRRQRGIMRKPRQPLFLLLVLTLLVTSACGARLSKDQVAAANAGKGGAATGAAKGSGTATTAPKTSTPAGGAPAAGTPTPGAAPDPAAA